ncbi:phosphate ABC transporter substrate-binding protein PstS [Derxia lacustris]|uniref:phosphate ABC transporter substrate-binding protein PstS n=1 Tax=Derxia lacustris TaxID=764842 RepID=UPI000A1774B2|nr:phosphate ABC transporter substrate-binding protein PstS [Derxia lacustris]
MLKKFVLTAAFATLGCAAAIPAQAAEVTGAGASFPAPLYSRWAADYQKATGNRVNYQSIGSSGGVKAIQAKTVDFGASDAPLKPEDLDKGGMVQFPTAIGGIVPVFNIAGVKPGELRLTGHVLADIFLGKITKWNDPAIVALNPGVKLPEQAIATVHRADGSGTTNGFTDYLSKVSEDWKAKVGTGNTVNWPNGMGGKGNEGVASFVARLPGSVGYVEYSYAKQTKMPYAALQNAAGNWVQPDDKTFAAAAAGADYEKARFAVNLNNQAGKDAWPITSTTFIIVYKNAEKPEQAAEVLKFFNWAYANGAAAADQLDYVALPADVVKLIQNLWTSSIKDGAGKAVAFK